MRAATELFTARPRIGVGIGIKYNILRYALDWHNIKSYVSHPKLLLIVVDP
jgi:hypothetical protein